MLRFVVVVLDCFFIWETKKDRWTGHGLNRWSSYTGNIVLELVWEDPTLVIIDEWSPYRDGCLRFDCIKFRKAILVSNFPTVGN